MGSETVLTPRRKTPLLEAQRRFEPATLHHAGQRAQHTADWFRPPLVPLNPFSSPSIPPPSPALPSHCSARSYEPNIFLFKAYVIFLIAKRSYSCENIQAYGRFHTMCASIPVIFTKLFGKLMDDINEGASTVSLSLSLYVSSVSLSLFVCLPLSVSVSDSLSVRLSLSFCLSVFLCLSACLPACLPVYLTDSV